MKERFWSEISPYPVDSRYERIIEERLIIKEVFSGLVAYCVS